MDVSDKKKGNILAFIYSLFFFSTCFNDLVIVRRETFAKKILFFNVILNQCLKELTWYKKSVIYSFLPPGRI